MPSYPRSKIVNDDEPGIYHCCTQVVQQQWLFGYDALTGRDFGYRKAWVEAEFRRVASFMAVEILDFSVMDNHLHLVVHTRPDVSQQMTDREVAVRWCYLCRSAGLSRAERMQLGKNKPPRPTEKQVRALINDVEKLAECRGRLSGLSWMMRLVCQPIARRANKEAGTRGRFFASRFKSQRIEDEAGLLACSMYVNMNPIRAGIVRDPEHVPHTSNFLRVLSIVRSQLGGDPNPGDIAVDSPSPDCWLSPVFLDPSAAAYQSIEDLQSVPVNYLPLLSPRELAEVAIDHGQDNSLDDGCTAVAASQLDAEFDCDLDGQEDAGQSSARPLVRGPVFSGQLLVAEVYGPRLTDRGYLPMSVEDYVVLAKWTAEQLLQPGLTKQSHACEILLDRVGLNTGTWSKTVAMIGRSFSTSVGSTDSLDRRAAERGLNWLKGRNAAATAFTSAQAVAS